MNVHESRLMPVGETGSADVTRMLIDHLDLWTGAVTTKSTAGRGRNGKIELTGIKKLRELILELAVRGKLVEQDPSDEPASVLLERIAEEKARLVKEGKIKKPKMLPEITEEEKLFELPDGWAWARMEAVSEYIQRGKGPKYADSGRVRVISQKCVQWSEFDLNAARFVDDSSLSSYQDERYIQDKDILWNSTGTGTVGRAIVVGTHPYPMVADSHVTIIRPLAVNPSHILNYISSPSIQHRIEPDHENSLVSGSTKQVELNSGSVKLLAVPLPPLSEQHRIVEKVDELMALCDLLEHQVGNQLEAHEALVDTLLDALTRSADAAELAENWARIAEHFNTLFTTEASIDKLKQAVLQLAVMGRLVPQDPNDEPASVLMEKIAEQKARLVKEGKIKKQKQLPKFTDEVPFKLPNNWQWCHFPDIGELARGKSKHRPRNDHSLYRDGTVPVVQTGDVARADREITTYTALYNESGVAQSKLWPSGTLCITIAANIGDTGILDFEACFPDSVVGFTPFAEEIKNEYFEYFLRTAKRHLEEFAPSTAQKNINLDVLQNILIPLPPAKELQNIVERVDELMALSDRLKACLGEAGETRTHLAEAVVEQAVS